MAMVTKRCSCKNKKACGHSWLVRWWVDGGRVQKEKSFRLNQAGAKKFAAEREAEKYNAAKLYGNTPAIKFGDYYEGWITSIKRPGTARAYESAMRVHLLPALRSKLLEDVAGNRPAVQKALDAISPGSRPVAFAALSAMLSHAMRDKLIVSTDFRHATVESRTPRPEPIFPNADQFPVLLDAIGADLTPAVLIMKGTGVRPGECLGLLKGDFAYDRLRVQRTLLRSGDLGPMKGRKAGAFRDTPVPEYVHQVVEAMPDGRLFDIGTVNFSKRFRIAADAAGLPALRAHDCRHWFASEALSRGVPISLVAKWMGHASVQITYATYQHLIPEAFDIGREVLDAAHKELTSGG